MYRGIIGVSGLGFLLLLSSFATSFLPPTPLATHSRENRVRALQQWTQNKKTDEWTWKEDAPGDLPSAPSSSTTATSPPPQSKLKPPRLPGSKFRPKQSLGQNFLQDQNTIDRFVAAFHKDACLSTVEQPLKIVELGPGPGALTNVLYHKYPTKDITCIEIDPRAITMLETQFPNLQVTHADVLMVDYPSLSRSLPGDKPIAVIGNLPYYITSQILFALADASHQDAVRSATVTMQREVGDRIVAPTRTKDYGILSVVFQLYADTKMHFKIPNTVFYPKPKVESALMGFQFVGSVELRARLQGVRPKDLQRVVKSAFGQRRKVVHNTMKNLLKEMADQDIDGKLEEIKEVGFDSKRPEELTPEEFVQLTKIMFGAAADADDYDLGDKVWRKEKHGKQPDEE